MKKWLVIVSVVALLLAVSTGAGLWKFNDTKAQLTDVEAQLTSMKAELTEIQGKVEENGRYSWETEYDWTRVGSEEGGTTRDLELRVEELEWTVRDLERTVEDLEWQLRQLENTLQQHGIY